MIYKDLNINLADMNVKIKFREETEISFQTMDIDSLKEIVLSNKKNLQNIEVEGKFSPEIFGLVTQISKYLQASGAALKHSAI